MVESRWGLTTDKTALGAHLVIEPGVNAQKVLKDATQIIREKYDLYEMTLQIEEFQNDMIGCDQCKEP
jgi:zinc transporter 2